MSAVSETNREGSVGWSPFTIGLCIFLGIAAFFLWQEHRAHLLGVLPYLFLLACPFVHMFMHRGHGGHGGSHAGHEHSIGNSADGGRS